MLHRDFHPTTAAVALTCGVLLAQQPAPDAAFLQERVLGAMAWRSIGPANFGGRILDFAVDPRRRSTVYVATASGGIFKSTNNGTTWSPVFDDAPTLSIGDMAIAPSNGDVLYVGTGEGNNQRSSYWGDGVYKTTDAGKTWRNVGLAGTDHIGRIVVHPTDANIVFVAALGALYTPNKERGLYRTKDGGETWECVKFVSEDVGFVDVVIDPVDPKNVFASSYERRRRAWHFDESGPGSAIWKSTDGGDTFEKLGGGLPSGDIGRIGLTIYPKDPSTLYAIVENNNPAPLRERPARTENGESNRVGEPREDGKAPLADQGPQAQDPQERTTRRRPVGGEVYRTDDGGATWTSTSSRPVGGTPHYYYGKITVDPNDAQRVYVLGVRVSVSSDGGKTWRSDFGDRLHSDHHALWIDPNDSRHALLGNDGGFARTWDGGRTWDFEDDLAIGQFYAIGVDMRVPYNVYGGTQDNGTWGIPSRSVTTRSIDRNSAYKINGGDGFHVCVDPLDPDTIYSESQFGALSRLDLASGQSKSIRPRAPRGSPPLRSNWSSPILLSPHNPHTVYFGTQYLHRSRDRGDHWSEISPDLTTNDRQKIQGNVPHCTITTIAESPLREGLLWVGTDDGRVWLTKNGGDRWSDLEGRFPELPRGLWCSRVEASPSDADTAYVAFTGYREDIRTPFLYLTTDGGETFRSIAHDLPHGGINVVREHPRNPDVLFCGTEFGVWTSVDAGGSWHRLGKGLPAVAVHDLLVHPREDDLVIGTHGRGLWVLDITAFADLGARTLAESFHVFEPRDGHTVRRVFSSGRYPAAAKWSADRVEQSAIFRYYLSHDADDPVTLTVLDATGNEVFTRRGDNTAGLHEVAWQARGAGGPGRGGGQRGGGRAARGQSGPGQYLLRVVHGERTVEHVFRVHEAIGGVDTNAADEEDVGEDRSTQERSTELPRAWIW